MKKAAVFLDRDGTIIHDSHYLSKIEDLKLYDFSAEAIRLLNEKNIPVIMVTNQSGVARGYFEEKDVQQINDYLNNLLQQQSAHIDASYYCPHHEKGAVEKYAKKCDCRKPDVGLINQALKDFPDIDISKSFVIGDKMADINLAINVGSKGVLVHTGHGIEITDEKELQTCSYIAKNLLEAVKWVLNNL